MRCVDGTLGSLLYHVAVTIICCNFLIFHMHPTPAPPSRPSVSVTPGLYDLMVMWTPYGGSPTHYTITLMEAGSEVSSSTSLTSTRFAGLPSDAAFSIAVVAINCAGNATTYVTTGTCKCANICCHGDTCTSHHTPVPLPPTSIGVEQVPQSTTTQLSITWTHVVCTVCMLCTIYSIIKLLF